MVVSLIISVLFIILIVLMVAGIQGQAKEGGKDLIKNVYVYLVLFATLMMTIGGSVGIFMAAADIVAPTPYYQSFEEYRNGSYQKDYAPDETIQKSDLSEPELRERYDAMVLAEKEMQIDRAKNTLIKSCGWIIVPLPVFIYFQRRLANSKEA